jgi:hypothetical protein
MIAPAAVVGALEPKGEAAGEVVGERERKVCGVGAGAAGVEVLGERERKVIGGGMRRVRWARG